MTQVVSGIPPAALGFYYPKKKSMPFIHIPPEADITLRAGGANLTVKATDLSLKVRVPCDRFVLNKGEVQTIMRFKLTEVEMFGLMRSSKELKDDRGLKTLRAINAAILTKDFKEMKRVYWTLQHKGLEPYERGNMLSFIQTMMETRRKQERAFKNTGDSLEIYSREKDAYHTWPIKMIREYDWDSWWDSAKSAYHLDPKLKNEAFHIVYGHPKPR